VGRGRRLGADRQIALRNYRHLPLTVTHGPSLPRWLAAVVRGHQACYAVPGNSDAVNAFRTQVIRHWRKALRRRSQRTRLTWARMNRIAARWIPRPAPCPQARFAAPHPR
jgi:RNA-directed DNA polymerase